MAVNKVVYDDKTLIDLTGDTVTAAKMLSGTTAHDKSGAVVTGTIPTKTSNDLTAEGPNVFVPAGYYASAASKAVAAGKATTPATTITSNPTISVDSAGKITASVSGTKSVTPTVSAGYVSSGTAGTITVSGSATKQLATQAAKTVTPSTSEQTAIAAGTYATGDVKVAAIPSSYVKPATTVDAKTYTPSRNTATIIAAGTLCLGAQTIAGDADLVAANIKKGVSIFGVTGTYTSDATAAAANIHSGKTAYVNGVKVTGTAKTYDQGVADGYADALDQVNTNFLDWAVVTNSSGCIVKIWNYHPFLAMYVVLYVFEDTLGTDYEDGFWIGPDSQYEWDSTDGDLGESIIDGNWSVSVKVEQMEE